MADSPRYCEHCGAQLVEGVAFCESCGTPVPEVAMTDAAATTVAAAPSTPEPAASAVAPAETADVGRGSPRWIPVVIGVLGMLIVIASIVSAR